MRYTARQRKIAARRKNQLLFKIKSHLDNCYAMHKPFDMASRADDVEVCSSSEWSNEIQERLDRICKKYTDRMNLPDSVKASRQREYNLEMSEKAELAAKNYEPDAVANFMTRRLEREQQKYH